MELMEGESCSRDAAAVMVASVFIVECMLTLR